MNNQVSIVNNHEVKLWSETFGDARNPAILLIAGAAAQGIIWRNDFCEKLVEQGFFVIRYDNRDTGKSSMIDYQKNPYKVMDFAEDAVAILDYYTIDKAHIVGSSMGGQIGQFIAAYFSERAQSLALLSTSPSKGFETFFTRTTKYNLSPPSMKIMEWMDKQAALTNLSLEDKISNNLELEKIMLGDKVIFDESKIRTFFEESYARSATGSNTANHFQAMQSSYAEHEEAMGLISVPTLIIHGKEDPIFGVDHAVALHQAIDNSKLVIIDDMGHDLYEGFYDQIIGLIAENSQCS
jgi:pimeloyl-ACP methyl ester carboxylesterase